MACIVLLRLPLLATNILHRHITEMNISPCLYVAHTRGSASPLPAKPGCGGKGRFGLAASMVCREGSSSGELSSEVACPCPSVVEGCLCLHGQ